MPRKQSTFFPLKNRFHVKCFRREKKEAIKKVRLEKSAFQHQCFSILTRFLELTQEGIDIRNVTTELVLKKRRFQ